MVHISHIGLIMRDGIWPNSMVHLVLKVGAGEIGSLEVDIKHRLSPLTQALTHLQP